MTQSLIDFVAEQQVLLETFAAWWLKQHRRDPENFPLENDPGEWDEQFQIFDPGWAEEKQMKFQVDNDNTGSHDIFGGLITEENAFFLNSHALDGEPDLKDLPIEGKQRRSGDTADSKVATAKASTIEGMRSVTYTVWRME